MVSTQPVRPRILLTRRWPDAVEQQLRDRFDVTVDADDRPLSQDALAQAMRDFDAVCPTVSDRIDADVLAGPGLRVQMLANYGVGFDHIDLDAACVAGITVTNTPGVLTEATADLAILLMLMASRRAGEGERQVRAGGWSGWRPTHLMGQSLSEKLLGLVGFGRIAQAMAARARAFGMTIAYTGRRRADPEIEAVLGARFVPVLGDLASKCDVLSLHCPGGAATRHLIDAAMLARMKPTAILVNTARGSVVDEVAIADALRQGVIAAAGFDVYADEPRVSPALLDLPNAVLLPHLGSATIEARTAMGHKAMDNLERFFAGQTVIDHVV
jgi:lactate dehydrogenase-like 2-hydroxyacid dehydrogenase